MAEDAAEPRVHAKDKDYTLLVRKRGAYRVLTPVGRYSESLLEVFAAEFLSKPGFLAMDLSRLDAVTLPLIRVLKEHAASMDPASGRVVFVSPPDRIRALLKLVDREGRIVITLSDAELEGSPEEVQARLERGVARVSLSRAMLETNPCWGLTDPEGRWLCPFCVTLRDDVRFVARGSPTQTVVDRVAHHLGSGCSTYQEGAADGWPFEVLERVLSTGEPPRKAGLAGGARRSLLEEPKPLDTRRRHLLPPSAPEMEGVEAALYYRPASPLTGDFYDFIRLGLGRWAVVLGGLTPCGVEPAVLMGLARKVLRIRLRESPDVATALARANDDLCEDLEQESAVTALVTVVDAEARRLEVARAGHAAPFLVRAGRGTVERLETPGPLLGLVPSAAFDEGIRASTLEVSPGDLLFLHGAALEGQRDASGERFGADRIAALLKAESSREATQALGAVLMEVEQFRVSGPAADDLTVMALRLR
jgi:hypothetical protein